LGDRRHATTVHRSIQEAADVSGIQTDNFRNVICVCSTCDEDRRVPATSR
jgi:hypothetical protein